MLRRALRKKFSFQPAVLPELKFDYGELEPVLSARLMEVHHNKHHRAYVANFNKAIEEFHEASAANNFPKCQALHKQIGFNGGGHINHSLFWENLAPASREGGVLPGNNSKLTKAINEAFGGYDNFIREFNSRTLAHVGSGWGWLLLNPLTGDIRYADTHNQETPQQHFTGGDIPLLTVDVWEHAYYLDYRNERSTFLDKIWDVMNWKVVEQRYLDGLKQINR